MTPDEIEALAEKRADAQIRFYIHALVFCMVTVGAYAVNYLTLSHPWRIAPFLGWGMALGIHGVVVFAKANDLKERLVATEKEKLKRNPSL